MINNQMFFFLGERQMTDLMGKYLEFFRSIFEFESPEPPGGTKHALTGP